MIIIRFCTKGLISCEPGKNESEVFVKLIYDNGDKVILKELLNSKKIDYFNSTFMRKSGFVSFYEHTEVFNIPFHERKIKKPNNQEDDSKINIKNGKQDQINLDNIESDEEDLDALFTNVKW